MLHAHASKSIGKSIKKLFDNLESRNATISRHNKSDLDSKGELLGRVGRG